MKIVEVPIDTILQDPSNARLHPENNMAAIRGSIAKFGQVEPLLVNKKTRIIIGGNGRYAAMKSLGYEKVKIVELDISQTDATALGLALNRTSELAKWDDDVLGKLLHSLREDNFELTDIGFDTSFLDDQDFVPNLPNDDEKQQKEMDLKIIIECSSFDQQQELFLELRDRGFKVK